MPPSPEPVTVRDLRRAQIVAAARALVAGEGLGALTIAALEARLPFSRGVITHHFHDKDDIVAAVLASATDEIDASTQHEVLAATPLADQLRAVLRSKVHGFLTHPEASRILLSFWGRLATDPAVRERNAAIFRRYRAQAARLVTAAQASRRATRTIDPAVAGALLVGLVLGIVEQALFEEHAIDVDAAVEEAALALDARLSLPARGTRRT